MNSLLLNLLIYNQLLLLFKRNSILHNDYNANAYFTMMNDNNIFPAPHTSNNYYSEQQQLTSNENISSTSQSYPPQYIGPQQPIGNTPCPKRSETSSDISVMNDNNIFLPLTYG